MAGKKTGAIKKTHGMKKPKDAKKTGAKKMRSIKNAASKPVSPPASSTAPTTTAGDTANIILSYKSLKDPAPAEMESAKQLINAQPAAKILGERPGMLKVSVPVAEKDKAHRDLKKLRNWDVCDEGVARMKKK